MTNKKVAIKVLSRILCVLVLLFVATVSQAQNCSKKKLASKDMRLDFDYRGQSLFLEMSNNDTTTLNIVKKKMTQLSMCHPKTQEVDFKYLIYILNEYDEETTSRYL